MSVDFDFCDWVKPDAMVGSHDDIMKIDVISRQPCASHVHNYSTYKQCTAYESVEYTICMRPLR